MSWGVRTCSSTNSIGNGHGSQQLTEQSLEGDHLNLTSLPSLYVTKCLYCSYTTLDSLLHSSCFQTGRLDVNDICAVEPRAPSQQPFFAIVHPPNRPSSSPFLVSAFRQHLSGLFGMSTFFECMEPCLVIDYVQLVFRIDKLSVFFALRIILYNHVRGTKSLRSPVTLRDIPSRSVESLRILTLIQHNLVKKCSHVFEGVSFEDIDYDNLRELLADIVNDAAENCYEHYPKPQASHIDNDAKQDKYVYLLSVMESMRQG